MTPQNKRPKKEIAQKINSTVSCDEEILDKKEEPQKITIIVNGQQVEVPMDGKTEVKVTIPVQSDPEPDPEPESVWERLEVIMYCIGGILRILPVLIIQLILLGIILWAIFCATF